jgi:hypothetical protein
MMFFDNDVGVENFHTKQILHCLKKKNFSSNMVVHTCNPSYLRSKGRRILVGQPWAKPPRPYLKNGKVQNRLEVDDSNQLCNKLEALSSNYCITPQKKKEKGRQKEKRKFITLVSLSTYS